MFEGTYTALVTPFRDGQVDYDAFQALIDRQAEAGIDGIVPVGTTGESPTITPDEHIEIIKRAIEFSGGRLKVVAGTGANSTAEAIHLTCEAERAGADGSLRKAIFNDWKSLGLKSEPNVGDNGAREVVEEAAVWLRG